MAVTVTQQTQQTTVIDSAADAITYLNGQYWASASTPFARGQQVNITNRANLPADIGQYNVGIVVCGAPAAGAISVMVLTAAGYAPVISIPVTSLSAR